MSFSFACKDGICTESASCKSLFQLIAKFPLSPLLMQAQLKLVCILTVPCLLSKFNFLKTVKLLQFMNVLEPADVVIRSLAELDDVIAV